jgi:hypothetical protein
MDGFTYPRGMTGTKQIQHAITALKEYPDIETRVNLQRQSSKDNILAVTQEGTPYEPNFLTTYTPANILVAVSTMLNRGAILL